MTRGLRLGLALGVLVFSITVAAFLPALQGQFLNWDDGLLFTKNLDYRGLGPAQLRWMFTTTLNGHYIPLTWLTLGLNYTLGGMNPWGYHLLSLLLHATNAVLFYLVARRLLAAALNRSADGTVAGPDDLVGGPGSVDAGALVAALVFAIHPQRVESVAWITERGTLLCGALYLTAVLTYLRAAEATGTLRWRWWGLLSLAAFAAALLAKGIAVSLPVTLLILDVYPLRRWHGRWRSTLAEKVPYAVVALAGAALVLFARTRGAQWSGLADYGLDARLAFAGYSFWFYPSRTVWPLGLSPLYEVPAHPGLWQWHSLGPLLGLSAATAVLVLLRRRFPGGLAAWVHSAAVVAPVSGIVHSGNQLGADRDSSPAQLGFALVAGYGVTWALRRRRQGHLSPGVSVVAAVGVTLVLAALAVSTWGQSGIWHDSESLWRWATEQDPECATCHGALGEGILYGAGGGPARLDESELSVRRAIALRPNLPVPHFTLGTILLMRGRYGEAEASAKTYMELAPGQVQGPARLALIYLVQDRPTEAVQLLRRARQLGARGPAPGRALLPDRLEPGSDPDFGEAMRLLGDDPEDLTHLGQALVQHGKEDRAVPPLQRAVALAPDAPGPRFWLIRAYDATGQQDLARKELATLRRLDPVAADLLLPVR
jgi:Flp pilus assembly protein TadD